MGRSTLAVDDAVDRRVAWVDYAKGFCIVFVVMMHSTLGVENAFSQQGWLHGVVAFARPFRMPDFFLISGLFLARVIARDWRTYLDRKVVHFAYFYVLWTLIQFAFKAPLLMREHGTTGTLWLYIETFWEPFGTLWFIYLLPIFFVVTRLASDLRVPPILVWTAAAALEMSKISTGFTVIDEFAGRYVYFFTGYVAAPHIFAFARRIAQQPELALAGLTAWGLVNGFLVLSESAQLPFISLTLGLAGACAVVSVSVLLAKTDMAKPLRYCGRNSIVIYLAFFLPMAASRTVFLKTGWIADIGTVSALVTLTGVVGALATFWAVRNTPLRFLFERPQRFHLAPALCLPRLRGSSASEASRVEGRWRIGRPDVKSGACQPEPLKANRMPRRRPRPRPGRATTSS
jgi:uncharacterized membrane protein YcfT